MSNGTGAKLPRNKLTLLDKLNIGVSFLPLPVVVIWALLKSPFTTYGRSKSWKRIAHDSATLRLMGSMNRRQLRSLLPTTLAGYETFMRQEKMEPVVEEIGEDARLLWIGPRQSDRVILYIHGGAFIFSAGPAAPGFWNFVRKDLESRGQSRIDVVMLNYTLVPDAMFPTQLKQAVLSIQRLLTLGFEPRNIQLVGDSAGAALIHQVLSHLLHPVEGLPELTLTTPLGGVYMMSPWTRLVHGKGSRLRINDGRDVIPSSTGVYWGSKVLHGAKPSAIPYLEAASAPEDWLQGIDKCVKRMLITAGDMELLRDDILDYGKHVQKYLEDTTIIVQENGIHADPFLDFLVGEKKLGSLTPKIMDWVEEGFAG